MCKLKHISIMLFGWSNDNNYDCSVAPTQGYTHKHLCRVKKYLEISVGTDLKTF